jgi:hypothetical protein
MNNGQTSSVSGTGKKEHKSQEPSELDRFVYPASLQNPTNNRQTSTRRGVVLTGRLVLSPKT